MAVISDILNPFVLRALSRVLGLVLSNFWASGRFLRSIMQNSAYAPIGRRGVVNYTSAIAAEYRKRWVV